MQIPTPELFPMRSEYGVLAIILPCAPAAFETSLVVTPPAGSQVTSARFLV